MLLEATSEMPNVSVTTFDGLLVNFAKAKPTLCCAAFAPSPTTSMSCRWP